MLFLIVYSYINKKLEKYMNAKILLIFLKDLYHLFYTPIS